jgi:CTP synthase (UTP-ammonia lyase)
MPEAEHEETAPEAPRLLIHKLSCSLLGESQTVTVMPDTLAQHAYAQDQVVEQFSCDYGLNPRYRQELELGGLRVAGIGQDGAVRIVELPWCRFFVATLFVPQLSSSSGQPHPLIIAYLRAALAFQAVRVRN